MTKNLLANFWLVTSIKTKKVLWSGQIKLFTFRNRKYCGISNGKRSYKAIKGQLSEHCLHVFMIDVRQKSSKDGKWKHASSGWNIA